MIVSVITCRPKMRFPILAWMIMLFQWMKPWNEEAFSHMAIVAYGMVNHITGKGFQEESIYSFKKRYKIISNYNIDANHIYFNGWLNSNRDKKYDRLQILGLAFKSLGFVTFNKLGHNYKKLVCCELAVSMIENIKMVVLGDSDNYDLITTEKLIKRYEI